MKMIIKQIKEELKEELWEFKVEIAHSNEKFLNANAPSNSQLSISTRQGKSRGKKMRKQER